MLDPRDNILAGMAYLRDMSDHFARPAFLAAYHPGSARYDDHLTDDRALPEETRRMSPMSRRASG